MRVFPSNWHPTANGTTDGFLSAADWTTFNTGATNIASHLLNVSNPHSVTKAQVGLNLVENTALSTWAGSASITTLGTIASGVWQGTAIGDGYISSAATWNAGIVTGGNSHDHSGGDGAQIAYSTLSGLPTLAQNEAGAANNFLTAYNSTTGAFSKAQPTWANINKATSSIADITTRSHTALTDIGTNTHAQIDTHIGAANPHSGSQPLDATLTSLALLGTAADKIAYTTAIDTWAEAPITAFGRTLIDDVDNIAARVTLGLVIGTNVQAYDATLQSLSALGTAADKIAYTTALDTWAETALTSFARSILDDANEATFKATVNLEIGTDVQAYNAGLADIAGLAKTDSNIIVGNGANWVAESGATARTSLGLGNVEDIALSTWAGSTSITTLGTIATGTWQGTDVGVAYGGTGTSTGSITGTGALTFTTGGANQNLSLVTSGSGLFMFNPGGDTTGNLYISGQNFNSAYSYNGADGTFGVNYRGYQNGTTQFRDFVVYDGKGATVFYLDGSANATGFGGITGPTAHIHIAAGTATASTAPLKFTTGTSLTAAEAGAMEFTTDDLFFTITTGAARKGFVFNDGMNLTAGRIPIAGTNGRLIDDADITFATDTLTVTNEKVTDTLTVPKTSGKGIKVDTTSPTFGWKDLLGVLEAKAGATDPTLTAYQGNIKDFAFSNAAMNEFFINYHLPHDYVPGSDIYLHIHWSQNVVDSGGGGGVPGDVKWYADVSYSKGHNQAAFPAAVTTSITQTSSGTQYQHLLGEVQLSAAAPSGSQIDSDNLEPDGIIQCRVYRDPADAADTLNQVPFVHSVDIHYQSTQIATKAKAPNFYT